MTYAPIALFTYSRPDHTRRAVESLLQNAEARNTDLYIYSDGPKTEAKAAGVEENRKYIRTITGFKSVTIVERETNWGLSHSLIDGITDIVERYGRVIVVEDDLILSSFFLRYMNEALDRYADDDRVASVSAFLNPIDGNVPESFFLRYFACWGWATWKRSWNLLINDSSELLRRIRWKTNAFNIGGTGPFYGILYCDRVGLNDSWAVRFYASCFLAGKVHLFPGRSMSMQNGMDGSGTHSGVTDVYAKVRLSDTPIMLADIPVEENRMMYRAFSAFYGMGKNKCSLPALYARLKSLIRRILGLDYRQ